MLDAFVHDVPASRVVFANGSLASVGVELERLGSVRAMLVAGGPEAVYADRAAQILGGRVVARFTDVAMHVPRRVANAAIAMALESQADSIVAVGGGSSIGAAKVVARELALPILAVPTTYAGSEMTPIWGLTEDDRKTTGRDIKVLPKAVLYDPELTLSLPPDLSAASGMNANIRTIGGCIGTAVMSTIVTSHTASTGLPTENGYLAGFGMLGYELAIRAVSSRLSSR